jgi:hypothetical protein
MANVWPVKMLAQKHTIRNHRIIFAPASRNTAHHVQSIMGIIARVFWFFLRWIKLHFDAVDNYAAEARVRCSATIPSSSQLAVQLTRISELIMELK